jgi:FHA domain
MATCPSGHDSADDDFCDVCGFAIGPTAFPSTIAAVVPLQCPHCGVPRAGQFCESCGYDFTDFADGGVQAPPITRVERSSAQSPARPPAPPAPAPAAQATVPPARATPQPGPPGRDLWTAVVTADRAYYDSVQATGGPGADGISFPVYCPQRRFRLAGAEVRVGRRSAHSGIDPEIDLTGPPADPGVSRLHAVLLRAADGSWSVVDPGSANGTLVNGTEIARDEIVPLRDGDRIHLGAWTELRIISQS